MKQKDLEKFIEASKNEEGALDTTKLYESVNISFNAARDKQKESFAAEREAWKSEYESEFIKELGFEDTSVLKDFVTSRKDIEPEQFNSLKQELDKSKNLSELYKNGFKGTDDDLEYVMFKASKMRSENNEVKFVDAIEQLKESRPSLFGTANVTTGVKNNKPNEDVITDPVYAAFLKNRAKRK